MTTINRIVPTGMLSPDSNRSLGGLPGAQDVGAVYAWGALATGLGAVACKGMSLFPLSSNSAVNVLGALPPYLIGAAVVPLAAAHISHLVHARDASSMHQGVADVLTFAATVGSVGALVFHGLAYSPIIAASVSATLGAVAPWLLSGALLSVVASYLLHRLALQERIGPSLFASASAAGAWAAIGSAALSLVPGIANGLHVTPWLAPSVAASLGIMAPWLLGFAAVAAVVSYAVDMPRVRDAEDNAAPILFTPSASLASQPLHHRHQA